MRHVLTFLLVLYGGLALVLYALQAKLMFPGAATCGTEEAKVTAPANCELVPLKTAAGVPVVALFGPALDRAGRPAADAAGRPTVLFFYGNGMCLADAGVEFEDFRRMGCNVLIPEYVGYGMSGGKVSEQGCYDTADTAWAYLQARAAGGALDAKKIVVAGWSLGGAVAIDLAARHPGEAARVMTFSAFTTAPDVGARVYPYLPVRTLMTYRFESVNKIGKIPCPILIGHGTRDEIVPFDMAGALAAAARATNAAVTEVPVPGAGHNDFFVTGGSDLQVKIWEFLKPLLPG